MRRSGFTLVELLIVIIILSMVTIAAIPIVRPALDTRRVREAARLVATHVAQAQARAIETGRPAGVWIERLRLGEGASGRVEPAAAMDLYLCEVPPPYAGDLTDAACRITLDNEQTVAGGIEVTIIVEMDSSFVPNGLIRVGDLIKFNYRGRLYRIDGPSSGPDDFIDDGATTLQASAILPSMGLTGWSSSPSNPVPYQIFRQPIKLVSTAVQLPAQTVLDLFNSGIGNDLFANVINPTTSLNFKDDPGPFGFTFSPTGALDKLYAVGTSVTLSNPVYLLVGKSEKARTPFALFNPTAAREEQTENYNFRDLENLWVSVNPQTGLVSTAEMAEIPETTTFDGSAEENHAKAVGLARAYARTAQTMGGR